MRDHSLATRVHDVCRLHKALEGSEGESDRTILASILIIESHPCNLSVWRHRHHWPQKISRARHCCNIISVSTSFTTHTGTKLHRANNETLREHNTVAFPARYREMSTSSI